MTQTIEVVAAISLLTGQRLGVRAACQCCGQDLNDGYETITLVSAGLLADTTNGKQCTVTLTHLAKDLAGIGEGVTILGNNQTCRSGLVAALVVLDLTVLYDGSSTVIVEGELLIGRNGEGEGVGTHHRLNTEGRCYGRTSIGTGDTDHTGLLSHGGPVTCDTVMGGIVDGTTCHAVNLCLLDQLLHHLVGSNHTHTVMSIHNYSGRGLLNDLTIGYRQQSAVLNTIQINRFETVAAVALNTATVRLQQNVCTDCCILSGNAVCLEYVDHEIIDQIPLYIRPSFIYCHVKNPP